MFREPFRHSPGRSLVAAVLVTLGIAACATSSQRLDPVAVRASRPRTLLLMLDPNDSFSGAPARPDAYHPVPIGLLGIAVAYGARVQAERDFVEDAALEDPALAMGARLAKSLAADYGLSLTIYTRPLGVPQTPGEPPDTYVPPSNDSPPSSDLVLTVHTTTWGLEEAPYAANRVGVHFEVATELSDARSQRLLAQGTCDDHDPRLAAARKARSRAQADALLNGVPTFHEMVALSGRRIVEELDRAGERCERRLRAEILVLGPPPASPPRAPVAPPPRVSPPGPSDASAPPAAPVKQQADDE